VSREYSSSKVNCFFQLSAIISFVSFGFLVVDNRTVRLSTSLLAPSPRIQLWRIRSLVASPREQNLTFSLPAASRAAQRAGI